MKLENLTFSQENSEELKLFSGMLKKNLIHWVDIAKTNSLNSVKVYKTFCDVLIFLIMLWSWVQANKNFVQNYIYLLSSVPEHRIMFRRNHDFQYLISERSIGLFLWLTIFEKQIRQVYSTNYNVISKFIRVTYFKSV